MEDATNPSKIFSVEGMVVCITGGGSGMSITEDNASHACIALY